MAGAKPQKRGSQITGVHVALFVFIGLWAGATTWAIIMLTNQEQLRQQAATGDNLKKTLLGPAGSDPVVQAMQSQATTAAKSLAGFMHERIKALSGRLTGNPADDWRVVETQWNGLLDDIAQAGKVPSAESISRSGGAIPALKQMYEWFLAENDAKTKALAALEEANKSVAESQAREKELEQDFKGKLDDLEKKVASISSEKDDFAKTKTKEIDDLTHNIAAKKDELTRMESSMSEQRQRHEQAIAKVETTLAQQASLLADYRSPGPEGTNELDIARQPVGRVLRALPGDALVHIDLGKHDGVKLGMPFAIYSFDKRVPIDGRGKATIEVVSVGEHTAECRTVTPAPPDDPILEEDLAGNIVLSRNRSKKPRFCVLGTFDVNYDGTYDAADYGKVVSFIERFGGVVVDEVDAETDYVVRGRRPDPAAAVTGKSAPGDTDPAAVTKVRHATRDATHYDKSIRQATALAIPRLSQDQFFNFVGLDLGRDLEARLSP
ncbi:MAG: hypothetical protein U1A27_04170 [Phycisphaerae bacterium]